MSRHRFIEAQRGHHSVRLLCQLMEVPASGYYAWQQAQQQAANQVELAWKPHCSRYLGCINAVMARVGYRSPCATKTYRVGRQRLCTAMRRRGLHVLQPKAFTPRTTDSTHGLRCAPNRLFHQPRPTQDNQVWVSDIAYLPLANGDWAYLCAYQDMVSK